MVTGTLLMYVNNDFCLRLSITVAYVRAFVKTFTNDPIISAVLYHS